jgi:hypothetical protein
MMVRKACGCGWRLCKTVPEVELAEQCRIELDERVQPLVAMNDVQLVGGYFDDDPRNVQLLELVVGVPEEQEYDELEGGCVDGSGSEHLDEWGMCVGEILQL